MGKSISQLNVKCKVNSSVHIWRKKGYRCDLRYIISTVKHGGRSIMTLHRKQERSAVAKGFNLISQRNWIWGEDWWQQPQTCSHNSSSLASLWIPLKINGRFEIESLSVTLNLGELKTICQEEHAKIEPLCCQKLMTSYCRRLEAVISKNRFATK